MRPASHGGMVFNIISHLSFLKEEKTPGAILEFGVFEGYSLSELAKFCIKNNLNNPLYGFDSFQGLPPIPPGELWKQGLWSCPKEECQKGLNDSLGSEANRVKLIGGWFKDTLTTDLQKEIGKAIAISIDSDLYSSCQEALNFCLPLLQPKTTIAFDEWPYGEDRAWEEFVAINKDISWTFLSSCSDQYIIQIK